MEALSDAERKRQERAYRALQRMGSKLNTRTVNSGSAVASSSGQEIMAAEHGNPRMKCSICLDEDAEMVDPIRLPCAHVFCCGCLREYFRHSSLSKVWTRTGVRVRCPNCREVHLMQESQFQQRAQVPSPNPSPTTQLPLSPAAPAVDFNPFNPVPAAINVATRIRKKFVGFGFWNGTVLEIDDAGCLVRWDDETLQRVALKQAQKWAESFRKYAGGTAAAADAAPLVKDTLQRKVKSRTCGRWTRSAFGA